MNLILLDSERTDVVLSASDPRAQHIIKILRRSEGDRFDVGIADGRMGKALIDHMDENLLRLQIEWTGVAPNLHPLEMVIGMPRPQTARRLLRELTALGVQALYFCDTERSEKGYGTSGLWTSGEFERHLVAGAEQAFNPRIPKVALFEDLESAIAALDSFNDRVALDNYEAVASLSSWAPSKNSVAMALGAERGWSGAEREVLRANGFTFYHLGTRVLRLESAAVAGVAIALSRLGLI